jgi:hypothetical protein
MLVVWVARIELQLREEESYRNYRPFAALVREHAPAPEEVVLFRTEAHALAFRVGRPLAVVVEWQDLGQRAAAGDCHVVTTPATAAEIPNQLSGVAVEPLGGNEALAGGKHERPLVLLRLTKRRP